MKKPDITLNIQEGINRVIKMYEEIYDDIINDSIVELQKQDIKTDVDNIKWISQDIANKCKEKENSVNAIKQCSNFYDLLEFIKNDFIFEGSEEIIIGAFLGKQIEISYK